MPSKYKQEPAEELVETDETLEPEIVEEVKPPATVINLLHDYGGRRTNELRIPAGMYRVDDPRLMGLANYLVESGHATRD